MRLTPLALLLSVLGMASPRVAHADPPPAALMEKLGEQAEGFEQMRNRASYTVTGELKELDSDGSVSETKKGTARVEADGHVTHVVVLSYTEDGKDKIDDARKQAQEGDEKRAKRPDEERLHMPFLPRERTKYAFDEVERDPANPTHVRITFAPTETTKYSIEGSAWVDEAAGTVLSASFRMTKLPMFVDYIHVNVEFGAATSLGPAVSKVSMDGGGGLFFFHKHFVGNATMSGYRIHPDDRSGLGCAACPAARPSASFTSTTSTRSRTSRASRPW